jgi:catechol 2,3-dioxygenase-like lactoylglutathione lyase family enzyme
MDTDLGTTGLVPELDVSDLADSITFYAKLGFEVAYTRPGEGFAYLKRGGVHLMLQTAEGPVRRFRTAQLHRPHGRGVNFQLEVEDVAGVHQEVVTGGCDPLIPLEDRWYRVDDHEVGNRQFVVADPDGYLWRPFENLGDRSI